MPSRAPVVFHFDFLSPYAFLAWTQIDKIAREHGRPLDPVPVLFAALLQAHGTKGPAEIPAKRRYLFKDIARKAHRMGVARVAPPPAHPFNPLVALRAASLPLPDSERARVIDALYRAAWTERRAIDTADAVSAVLSGAGLDGPAIVAAAAEPPAKARLRANTDAALAAGVFGVPTMLVDGEMFWGTDALADLEAFLAGALPAFSDALWKDLPAAAVRKPT